MNQEKVYNFEKLVYEEAWLKVKKSFCHKTNTIYFHEKGFMTLYMHVRYIFMYFEDYVEVALLFFIKVFLL